MKIICTLGPSSYPKKILKKLKAEGVNIFRINLSHTPKNQIFKKIKYLKSQNIKNICIDTKGAQVRTSKVKKKIFLKKNFLINLKIGDDFSNNKIINFHPNFDITSCKKNTFFFIGFDDLVLKVTKIIKNKKILVAKVINSGYLESNKGVHISKNVNLDPLTEKDKFAIKLAIKHGVKYYAMSFVNRGSDIDTIRKLISKSFLISKIETNNALNNLNEIMRKSDALLIDRGDLSRYVPIEYIPVEQERIIKSAIKKKKPVYVATNLLENMVTHSQPTRAESHDIFSTIRQGASGLVLAAETAIGKNPLSCVKFLKKSIRIFE